MGLWYSKNVSSSIQFSSVAVLEAQSPYQATSRIITEDKVNLISKTLLVDWNRDCDHLYSRLPCRMELTTEVFSHGRTVNTPALEDGVLPG
jgi:hypothetical protein